jgi:predicted deacylase
MSEQRDVNEQAEIPIAQLSYAKFIESLVAEARRNNQISVTRIGDKMSETTGILYHLYRLEINPKAERNICVVAGIHGVEIAGPLAILTLTQSHTQRLLPMFRYIIYPVLNPYGFDARQRFTDSGRDLNALYAMTLNNAHHYQEIQSFYQDIQTYKHFDAVITLHEDVDLDRFYMYGLGKENIELYHQLCAVAEEYCAVWSNADVYGWPSDEFGLVFASARDHAVDGSLYAKGWTKVAFTVETPGKLRIGIRINLAIDVLIECSKILAKRI